MPDHNKYHLVNIGKKINYDIYYGYALKQGQFLSLKNDIEMVKEELNSEEQFFEKAVMTERFVKKYKNVMIGAFVVVVLGVSGNLAYQYNKQSKIAEANQTLALLQKNPSKSLESKLNSLSPTLFDVWRYANAIANKDTKSLQQLSGTKTLIVDDLVQYELAQSSNDVTKLDNYAAKQNAIYKDLAIIESAIILIKENKITEAHEQLSTIALNSSMHKLALALKHYGMK